MSTPFELDRGTHQQRIVTAHAAEGAAAYELGHASHLDVNLAVGDRHEISQTFTVSPQAQLVRARVRIKGPPGPVAQWVFEARLNGVVHYSRRLAAADRIVQVMTLGVRLADANVAPATNVIAFRLRLA